MFIIVSMAAYAGILWVIGMVVIRECRRARDMDHTQTTALPYSMSQYDRP
jgi:hypothetical protein